VLEASKHPDLFCSGKGTNIGDMPPDFLEFLGSMINMDDPRHARLRRIVSRGFTPKQLDAMKGDVEATCAEIVDDVIANGEGDFVTDVAATLPLRIIVDMMMGIPRSQERFIFDRTNVILGLGDPEYVPDQTEAAIVGALLGAAQDLSLLITELAEDRVKDPKDDLTTALVTAEVDGESLSPSELASFFILLVVAGNETTRNAISHGLLALTEHEDQMAAWQADFDALAPTAVEEIVRWATPVIHFRRTVTQDGVRLGDQELSEGDKVVLWYASANRDAAVFEDPFRFDLARTPTTTSASAGPGPHFCLGAHLARREITVMFRELFRRMPDLRAAGQPVRLRSNFINGIKHLPATWTPSAA
jgi:methyl-branched lipid omega-hydroxylase